MSFPPGALVKARGREWVVTPESSGDLLVLRPLGGTDEETAGIWVPLEPVEPASFAPPDPSIPGDHRSCSLLRDAVRLSFRNTAGPFRCFGRIAVEPRPYQLVPLLMSLRLDPVRMLIADDVGVGKTIEACLIVRELLDRGEIRHFSVLCPSHLAEQWQGELLEKFHIEAELVLPGTVRRLEGRCALNQSVFEKHPFTVVSMDYIKSDRHRDEFRRACPEMVVVDEAHGCAYGVAGQSGRHQRHELVRLLSQDSGRHLILVTATPHSGNEEAFRSLLGFLDPGFSELPENLAGEENEPHRRRLAQHLIQRTRGDVRGFLSSSTIFPDRVDEESSYRLSPAYRDLFSRVLGYARESVASPAGRREQRVRYWSALALLRSLSSSPRAAAQTLRNRAANVDSESPEEADELGRSIILDLDLEQGDEAPDVSPGAEIGDLSHDPGSHAERLRRFALDALKLQGEQDSKLQKAASLVEGLVRERFNPIVFCRFIETAEYVAEQLSARMPGVTVSCVTGRLSPDDRERRIADLSGRHPRILVCTDCLSEGINLQDAFDAVLHYDLSWNPMRHEQRAGRVDRFGQPGKTVKILTFYGEDNAIDARVLEVLLRKHQRIRSRLGISVPVPARTSEVIEALVESLLSSAGQGDQLVLSGFETYLATRGGELFDAWEQASDREKRSRSMFAHHGIDPREVAREMDEARRAAGSGADVESFVRTALQTAGAVLTGDDPVSLNLAHAPAALRDAMGMGDGFRAAFALPAPAGLTLLSRTHPAVEGLASWVFDTALDPGARSVARRCGMIRTGGVGSRTVLLLLRFRYHIVTTRSTAEERILAENCHLAAFRGTPEEPAWLPEDETEALLSLRPGANTEPDLAAHGLRKILEAWPAIEPHVEAMAKKEGARLLESHRRVRTAAGVRGLAVRVEVQPPADLVGLYVFQPDVTA